LPPPLPAWSIPTEALYVGITAPGTLTIENGGSVSNRSAYVGNVSTGTVTVTGIGSTWHNSSVVNIGYGAVPGYPGTGTLTIKDGGYVYSGVPGSSNTDTAVSGIIGTFYAGVGTVTVSGTDVGGHASTWENAGQLMVGRYGSGTLTIEGGGGVSNADDGYIGVFADNTGTGNGTVTVSGTDGNGHASTWAGSADLYVSVWGTGTLNIEAGGVVSNVDGVIGYGNTGTATVSGTDGSGHASAWNNSGDLYVGYYGDGTLNIEVGGTVSNGDGYIGYQTGSTGTVTVSGSDGGGHASTWTNTGDLYVGVFGTGTLSIEAGGTVSNGDGVIGYDSTGTATVTGTDGDGHASTWTSSGDLYAGYYGDGTLTVADGGVVDAAALYIAEEDGSAGTLNIGAAAGEAAVAAGTLDAATIAFGDGTGTFVFNHTGAITFAAALASTGSGTHALDHYAGTTTLTGDSSGFTGTTTVDGGTLEIARGGKLGGSARISATRQAATAPSSSPAPAPPGIPPTSSMSATRAKAR
jgi:T5SS/PEP-CTERM-associated repeat protein/autotransporter-associated beta strand protein